MEHEKAIAVLKGMLDWGRPVTEEKEAVTTAIGAPSWGKPGESRAKARKAKRDRGTRWQQGGGIPATTAGDMPTRVLLATGKYIILAY